MSRVALFRNTPDSFSPDAGNGACIARTERFRSTMKAAGHEVLVCSPPQTVRSGGSVATFLRDRGPFDFVAAISPFPAEPVTQSGCTLPVWIDMNGMHPAEIQLAGTDVHTNRLEMFRMLALEHRLLARGDRFSAPSARQTDSILGQLFLLGRLDCGSRGVQLRIHSRIAPFRYRFPGVPKRMPPQDHQHRFLQQLVRPPGGFHLLGGRRSVLGQGC